MQLIGYLDSPFVRRVAISADLLGIDFEHRELSIWRDFDEFRRINPLVKVPTLLLDDGTVLVESSLIIDYIESMAPAARRLMPTDAEARKSALRQLGITMVALEKSVALIYELRERPEEKQHGPWIDRLFTQLRGACSLLEAEAGGVGGWLHADRMMQPDITLAVAWTFIQARWPQDIRSEDYPAWAAFTRRAEATDAFTRYQF